MKPNPFIQKLKEYPLVSHCAWELPDKKSVVKADWNEADTPLPKQIREALISFINDGPTYWYPDIANKKLTEAIASYVELPQEYVQYFEGSDCALDYVVRTFVQPNDVVAVAAPTYDNFRVYVESVGARAVQVVPEDMFTADIDAFIAGVPKEARAIYIVNPNNPTGIIYSADEIEKVAKSFPEALLIVDEAYAEFCGKSVVSLVQQYNNIVISRSFSKAFSLASFRIGYIASDPENIRYINKIRNGKNIPTLSQIAALEALKDQTYMKEHVRESQQASEMVCRELAELGFDVRNTVANWVLVRVPDPVAFRAALEKERVFVRGLAHLPGMESYIRVTLGSAKSAELFINTVKRVHDQLT